MPTYEKIDANTFVEISETRRTITRAQLIAEREKLRNAYESLVEPTNQELLLYAQQVHPYFTQRQRLRDQWQILKDLITY